MIEQWRIDVLHIRIARMEARIARWQEKQAAGIPLWFDYEYRALERVKVGRLFFVWDELAVSPHATIQAAREKMA